MTSPNNTETPAFAILRKLMDSLKGYHSARQELGTLDKVIDPSVHIHSVRGKHRDDMMLHEMGAKAHFEDLLANAGSENAEKMLRTATKNSGMDHSVLDMLGIKKGSEVTLANMGSKFSGWAQRFKQNAHDNLNNNQGFSMMTMMRYGGIMSAVHMVLNGSVGFLNALTANQKQLDEAKVTRTQLVFSNLATVGLGATVAGISIGFGNDVLRARRSGSGDIPGL